MERDTVAWPTPKTSAATSWVAYVLQWNGSRSTRLRRSSANLRPAPIARFRGLLESLPLSASGCAFSTFASNKSNSPVDMPMRTLKRLALSASLSYDSIKCTGADDIWILSPYRDAL